MSGIIKGQPFWVLVFIHIVLVIICIYFKLFKSEKLAQVHRAVSSNYQADNSTNLSTIKYSLNPYLGFPKLSPGVVLKCVKLNHLIIKSYIRNYSIGDRLLEVVSSAIFLIGVLGLTGSQFNAWPKINFFLAGIFGGFLARVFHSWYSTLQEKQEKIPNEFSSNSKLVRMVEAEVIKRLNIHRTMRRVFGYLIMILYYAANLYYCIKFIISFDSSKNYNWFLSFMTALVFDFFILEIGIVIVKIQAINFLKIGGSELLETFCRVMVNDDFLKTFN